MVQPKSYKGIKVEGKIVGMVGSDVQCSGLNVLPAHPSFDSFAPPAWESLMVRLMMIEKWKLQRFRWQEDKKNTAKELNFWCFCKKPTLYSILIESGRWYCFLIRNKCNDILQWRIIPTLANPPHSHPIHQKHINTWENKKNKVIYQAEQSRPHVVEQDRLWDSWDWEWCKPCYEVAPGRIK